MAETHVIFQEQDPVRRRRAVLALDELPVDKAAREALILGLLGDVDIGTRKAAIQRLSALHANTPILTVLTSALRADELVIRSTAMEVIARIGATAVPILVTMLDDDNDGVRRIVVDTLGMIGRAETFLPLSRAVRDKNAAVRSAALESLLRASPEKGQSILIGALRTEEVASVRLAALLALERAKVSVPSDILRAMTDDGFTVGPALRMLGRAGDIDAILGAVESTRGSRMRAALIGLLEAARHDPIVSRATIRARTVKIDHIEPHIGSLERQALLGALYLAAIKDRTTWFADALSRLDVGTVVADLDGWVGLVAGTDLPSRLIAEANTASDNVATLLQELAGKIPAHVVRTSSTTEGESGRSLSRATFSEFAKLFSTRAGLALEAHTAYRVESRLRPRVDAGRFGTFEAYLAHLREPDGRAELAEALARVTVHETYFYREPHQLEVFRRDVLSSILRARNGKRPLHVWSAGCSSGEEAWTLAMILEETKSLGDVGYHVFGTDLAEESVAVAKAGRYGRRSMRGELPAPMRTKFLVENDGAIEVVPALHDRVTFSVRNLMTDPPPTPVVDVIFCRNVLIYLTREARAALVQRFFDVLAPGGALLLGHSESLLNADTPFVFVPIQRELVYVKPFESDGDAGG